MPDGHRVNKTLTAVVLAVAPLATALVCLGIGRIGYSPTQIVDGLWSMAVSGRGSVDPQLYSVLIGLRLPRIILAMLAGAGMALAGCSFQSLFSNVMATPDTLGVTAGASFGAVLAILLGGGMVTVQLSALAMGIGAVALTMAVGTRGRSGSTVSMILAGIIVSSMFQAFTSLVKYVADPDSKLPAITYWLMGSLTNASYQSLWLGAPFILAGILVLYMLRWKLNILVLSDDEIRSLGSRLPLLRGVVIAASTMITASCISMCGQVGWVGLLVPHFCRLLVGGDHRRLVPACISLGAVFLLVIDTVARAATAAEIPISILTALIGAPVFLFMMRKAEGLSR